MSVFKMSVAGKMERRRKVGREKGHVTPSFRTDDNIDQTSNCKQVSFINHVILTCHESTSQRSHMRFRSPVTQPVI